MSKALHRLHLKGEGLFHDPFGVALQVKSLATLTRGYGLYCFHPFQQQAVVGLSTIKPCCSRNKAFSL
jgi:hypothetical protein